MKLRSRTRVFLGLLAVAAAIYAGWRLWAPATEEVPVPAPADTTGEGVRVVTLWVAADTGDSLVALSQPMVEREDLHARLEALVEALSRPTRRGVPALPAGTTVLHAYLDERGLLVLDLSRSFAQGFNGGSRAEDMAVGSLLRTVGANVPQVRRVLLTCDGAALASLGGHVPLDRPLEIQDW